MGGPPGRGLGVVGLDPVARQVVLVNPARHKGRSIFRAGQRQARVGVVEAVVVPDLIVEPDHIHRLGNVDGGEQPAVHGRSDWPRRVQPLHQGRHPAHHLVADLGPLHRFLVEDGPHKHAGMVAVAPDQPFELAHVLWAGVEVAVLVHDQQAELVALVEQLNGGRVMGTAVGVDPHFLELAQAERPQGIGHGHAHAGMVLVIADALDLQGAAIQEESAFGIETEGAETAPGDHFIHPLPPAQQAGLHAIQHRLVHRPQARRLHRDGQPHHGLIKRFYLGGGAALGHRPTCGIQQDHFHGRPRCRRPGMGHRHLHRHSPPAARPAHRLGEHSIRRDVGSRALHQPGVPIDPGPLVPPALHGVGIHAHRDGVHLVAVGGKGREVDIEGGVAAPVAMHDAAVEPDRAMGGYPVHV